MMHGDGDLAKEKSKSRDSETDEFEIFRYLNLFINFYPFLLHENISIIYNFRIFFSSITFDAKRLQILTYPLQWKASLLSIFDPYQSFCVYSKLHLIT